MDNIISIIYDNKIISLLLILIFSSTINLTTYAIQEIIYEKIKSMWLVIFSALLVGLGVVGIIMYITYMQLSIKPYFIDYCASFYTKNSIEILFYIIGTILSVIIAFFQGNRIKKNIVRLWTLLIMCCTISVVILYLFYGTSVRNKVQVPTGIIENTYYTLPLNLVFEDKEYFDGKLYEGLLPIIENVDEEPAKNEMINNDDVATTNSFSELISFIFDTNDINKQRELALKAYDIYIDKSSELDVYDVANMWFYLGRTDSDYDKRVSYYEKAKDAFLSLGSYYNAAVCYSNLNNYPKANIYYRRVYQNINKDEDLRIKAVTNVMKILSEGDSPITSIENEYNTAVGYFSNYSIGILAGRLAEYYYEFQMIDSALSKYQDAIKYVGDSDEGVNFYINCAEIYKEHQDYINAKLSIIDALHMVNASEYIKNNARNTLRSLAKEVYFSDFEQKYTYVIECFNTCEPLHSEEMVYLYFQSLLQTNKPIDISEDSLAYFSGQKDIADSRVFLYKPKIMIYCAGIYLKMGNENGAISVIDSLDNLYNIKPENFNDADIVNYVQLLSKFRNHTKAYSVFYDTMKDECSTEVKLHRNVLMPCVVYFAKRLSNSVLTKDESQELINIISDAVPKTNNTLLLNRAKYSQLLLSYNIDSDIDFSDFLATLPRDEGANLYFLAFLEYRKNNNYEKALELCERILELDPSEYDGFSRHDVILLDGNISLDYAELIFNSFPEREEEAKKIGNRALQRFQQVYSETGYLYGESLEGIKRTNQFLGIPNNIAIPMKEF